MHALHSYVLGLRVPEKGFPFESNFPSRILGIHSHNDWLFCRLLLGLIQNVNNVSSSFQLSPITSPETEDIFAPVTISCFLLER